MLSDSKRDRLLAYLDDRLDDAARADFEQQLNVDAELRQAREALREWQSAGNDWEEVAVPAWSRLRGVTSNTASPWPTALGWFSLSASTLAILLLLFQAQLTVSSTGFSLRFGPGTSGVSEQQVEQRLAELEQARTEYVNQRLDLMEKKSLAMNRQLLSAALEYNRVERQEDMRFLVASWSRARNTDLMRVDDLRDSQFDDRMAIRQLYTRLPDTRMPDVR